MCTKRNNMKKFEVTVESYKKPGKYIEKWYTPKKQMCHYILKISNILEIVVNESINYNEIIIYKEKNRKYMQRQS